MSAEHQSTSTTNRHRVEGPKNHYMAYIVSIILTMLSFAAVIYGGLDKSFLLIFLVGLAVVQTIFQLTVWMHMKERGHLLPMIGLSMGALIALTAVIAAEYWMWW
jgi:cytochrome c oxidase subunit 4